VLAEVRSSFPLTLAFSKAHTTFKPGDDYRDDDNDEESMDSFEEAKASEEGLGFGGLRLKRQPQVQNKPANADDSDDSDEENDLPEDVERKKTKRERMKELMSKSKFFRVCVTPFR